MNDAHFILQNNQEHSKRPDILFGAIKSLADRNPYYKHQNQKNSKNSQFYFHVLIPHFSPNSRSLLFEILSLKYSCPRKINNHFLN